MKTVTPTHSAQPLPPVRLGGPGSGHPAPRRPVRWASDRQSGGDAQHTISPEQAVQLSGHHVCNLQRHLLRQGDTTAARAAATITHTIHRMAGVPMPEEGTHQ